MRINVLTSFAGFIILIAGLYCPILRPFHVFNIDGFGANKPYGMVLLLVGVVGIIATVFNQAKITKTVSFIALGLAVLFYLAALLKVRASFSFIPFHSIDAFLARQIKFKWGWFLILGGPLLAVAGVIFGRKPTFTNNIDAPVKQNQ
jgi:predicted membrane channel-forming protein YqfA (hemolysin III family)